jgi:hypothetical protein
VSCAIQRRSEDGPIDEPEAEPEVDVLTHLESCGVCAAVVRSNEEAEGRALAATAPAAMTQDAAARRLALIRLTGRREGPLTT